MHTDLESAYQLMAQDEERERDALEWAEALIGDVASFLAADPSEEAVINFRFSTDVENRVRILLEKNNEGQLSEAEDAALDRLVELEDQLQLPKARALASLS